MAGLSFLSPLYLFGLLLPAIPIVIHLWSKHRRKEIEYSDIRFIESAMIERERALKLEDRRLLALRVGLLALFALALAKPVIRLGATKVGEGATSAAFVVDDSFSMGTSDNGVIRMDRARQRLREIAGLFRGGDDVTLITASERPRVLLRRVDASSSDPGREIDRIEPSFYASNLATGIQLASSILDEVKDKKREIYVITDMQALAWEGLSFDRQAVGRKDVDLFLIDVGSRSSANTAVTGMESTVMPPENGETIVESVFKVHCYGALPEEKVWLREILKGEEEARVPVEFVPGGQAEQRFRNHLPGDEIIAGYVDLSEDALPVDNRFFFVHKAYGKTKILVVDGNPIGDPQVGGQAASFYFVSALEALAPEKSWTVQVETVSRECDRTAFGPFDLVAFVDVPDFTAASAESLKDFLEGGGRAVFFLGDKINPSAYNDKLGPDILHLRIGEKPVKRDPPAFIRERKLGHRLFSLYDSENADIEAGKFSQNWVLILPQDAPLEFLAAFDNGDPALVEVPHGEGRTLVFSSSIGREWSSFPTHPLYVPWVGEIAEYLLGGLTGSEEYRVGAEVKVKVAGPGGRDEVLSIEVERPDGNVSRVPISLSAGSSVYRYGDTHAPGVYRFRAADTGSDVAVSPEAAAVNVDTKESDPETVSVEEVEPLLSAFRVASFGKSLRFQSLIYMVRKGRPVWDYLLILVLILLLVETIYGNRVRRSR